MLETTALNLTWAEHKFIVRGLSVVASESKTQIFVCALFQIYDDYGVEGEMSIPNQSRSQTLGEPDFNTLDEPIRDTVVSCSFYFNLFYQLKLRSICFILSRLLIYSKTTFDCASLWIYFPLVLLQLRDLKAVGIKFYHVLIPKERKSLLKECKAFIFQILDIIL